MKILHLCKKFPWPVKDGETLAIHALASALAAEGAGISLLAMNTSRHPYAGATGEKWPDTLSHYQEIRMAEVDNRIRPVGAFLNLFSKASYHISRFESVAFRDNLIAYLQSHKFDVCILETLYLAPYIPIIREYSKAKVVMRAHNVESEVWERVATNLPPGLKRSYLRYLVGKLYRYEQQMLPHYDLIAAITQRDLDKFRAMGFKGEGIVLPAGLRLQDYPCSNLSQDTPFSIGFIGSLDWAPNTEGLRRFLRESWPQIHQSFPNLILEIAGRNTPVWLEQLSLPGVFVTGEVADAKAFIRRHRIMIAPLYSGGGIRVKILEAMALGTPTLNTTMAIEGIPAADRIETLLADSPGQFVEQLRFALNAPGELQAIAVRARKLMEDHFDQQKLARQLLSVL